MKKVDRIKNSLKELDEEMNFYKDARDYYKSKNNTHNARYASDKLYIATELRDRLSEAYRAL